MKICCRCRETKDISNFGKNSKMSDGLQNVCKSCLQLKYLKDQEKPDFIEKRDLNFKKHKDNNPDYYKQKDKENYENNKELWKLKNFKYKTENKEIINGYLREKYKSDPVYRNKRIVLSLIRHGFKNKGFKKDMRTHQILGCSYEEFKLHLESKFESWMNWENQGKYNGIINFGWDIDHIIPISSAKTEEDIIRLNHYTNFQPLCSYINRYIKGNKLNYKC